MDPVIITRTAETQWEAVSDGRTVGHGDISHRPDGRLFVSVDVWQDPVFDRLATAVLADLPATPVHTLVAADDPGLKARWERLGFAVGRREREYTLPTAPGALAPPPEVVVLPGTEADPGRLRALDRAIREEVEASVGWRTMPAEVVAGPTGSLPLDPAKYAVATRGGRYAGLVRVAAVRRRARIGLIAVRAEDRRHGIGRALLAHALGSLHHRGITSAWAEVDETNTAALALFEGAGAERTGGCIELVRH
ncbi:acetyltransferase (GNAT) family protein [Streptomyces sp. 3211.6]|uniref:GNAT family N-acetyltransferase n=1 Tax=Streptomyces TaxID=1883 RepID=UPI0009A558B8|nr:MULTISPECIES: GNAT family N-acetyltransferase [Streptomyces]RKT08339.1 acetyltransferase (GNAT) family protein [Streptomyces sp. 3211.6]